MDRAQVIAKLKAVEPGLRAHGIGALYLYGSFARGEARPDSDVDIFVDKTPGRRFGLHELMGSYRLLHEALPGMEVGFGTRQGLSKYIVPDVEREAIRIF
jgi:predicted nucleotidyltransferase